MPKTLEMKALERRSSIQVVALAMTRQVGPAMKAEGKVTRLMPVELRVKGTVQEKARQKQRVEALRQMV